MVTSTRKLLRSDQLHDVVPHNRQEQQSHDRSSSEIHPLHIDGRELLSANSLNRQKDEVTTIEDWDWEHVEDEQRQRKACKEFDTRLCTGSSECIERLGDANGSTNSILCLTSLDDRNQL